MGGFVVSRKPLLSIFTVVALAACSGQSGAPSSAPASVLVTPGATQAPTTTPTAKPAAATAATPAPFTSLLYGYSLTVPAGWNVGAAMLRWDGASSPGHDDGSVDKFVSPATVSAWGYSGPVSGDLDQFVKDNIAWTVRDHGDTCPATKPDKTEAIQIGGEAGVLLSWNCGILINEALLVRDGTGFVFVMRDPAIQAATDPADRATFEALLHTVTLPG
jgi:hypothetical protein